MFCFRKLPEPSFSPRGRGAQPAKGGTQPARDGTQAAGPGDRSADRGDRVLLAWPAGEGTGIGQVASAQTMRPG